MLGKSRQDISVKEVDGFVPSRFLRFLGERFTLG